MLARYLIQPTKSEDDFNKNATDSQWNIKTKFEKVVGKYKLIDSGDDTKFENAFRASEHLFQLRLGHHMGSQLA